MSNITIHVGLAPDGAIVNFKDSDDTYLKVRDEFGLTGVVRLSDGFFVYTRDIHRVLGLDVMDAYIVARNLDEYCRNDRN